MAEVDLFVAIASYMLVGSVFARPLALYSLLD